MSEDSEGSCPERMVSDDREFTWLVDVGVRELQTDEYVKLLRLSDRSDDVSCELPSCAEAAGDRCEDSSLSLESIRKSTVLSTAASSASALLRRAPQTAQVLPALPASVPQTAQLRLSQALQALPCVL